MIQIIQGTPGSGKSAVCTVDMIEYLKSGGVVACNYSLVEGWHYKLADRSWRVRLGLQDRDALAESYWHRAFKVGTVDTIYQLSDRLKKIVPPDKNGKMKEGAGRLYLDEAQLLFNSRNWRDNKGFIEFFTQHRKLGWDVYLIAHSIEMIDSQIRFLIEYEARLRNLKKIKLFGLIPLSPYPVFISIVRYAGISAGAGMIAWRRVYALNKEISSLYDSMQVFAFDAAQIDVTHQGELHLETPKQQPEKEKTAVAVPPGPIVRAGINIQPAFWHPYYMRRYPELRHARGLVDRAGRYGFAPYSLLPDLNPTPTPNADQNQKDN